MSVNSYHHQAPGRLGEGVVATAVAPDGTVEAIELSETLHPFCLGVQWHPDVEAGAGGDSARLFEVFVAAAAFRLGAHARGSPVSGNRGAGRAAGRTSA